MAKTFLQRFVDCFEELNCTENVMLVVVRGHLYCESALAEVLRKHLQRPEEIQIDRLEFQAKVNLCSALGALALELKPGLTQLGKLRNKYVHQLDYKATENDQTDLVNSLKSTIGMPAQFYLRRVRNFPSALRRCVIALWLPLEMHCVPREETRAMLEQMARFGAAVSGQSDEEWRRFCHARAAKFFEQRGEQMPSNLWLNADARDEQDAG